MGKVKPPIFRGVSHNTPSLSSLRQANDAKKAEKEAAKLAQSRELYEKYKTNGNAEIGAQKYDAAVRW